ncbi:hypothetical protein IRB23M11_23750 [Alkalibacterium sp. m-11]
MLFYTSGPRFSNVLVIFLMISCSFSTESVKLTNVELIEIIEEQAELIKSLSNTIARMLLQHSEQESLIEELMENN